MGGQHTIAASNENPKHQAERLHLIRRDHVSQFVSFSLKKRSGEVPVTWGSLVAAIATTMKAAVALCLWVWVSTAYHRTELMKQAATQPGVIQKNAPVIVQYGPQRTATTFQYEVLCAGACLKWGEQSVICEFVGGIDVKRTLFAPGSVVKTHTMMHAAAIKKNHPWVLVFTTLKGSEAMKHDSSPNAWRSHQAVLSREWGIDMIYVQVFESLGLRGHNIVYDYQPALNLTNAQADAVAEYMKYWEILRRCCGAQMSDDYRHRLFERYPLDAEHAAYVPNLPRGVTAWNESHTYLPHRTQSDPSYDSCEIYDIGEVERALMRTAVYKQCRHIDQIRRISTSDLEFNGRYCERAVEATAKYHLNAMDKSYHELSHPERAFGQPLREFSRVNKKVRRTQLESSS